MEAACSSEMLVFNQKAIGTNFPEDHNLMSKSYFQQLSSLPTAMLSIYYYFSAPAICTHNLMVFSCPVFITMYNVNAHLNFITMYNVNAHLNFITMYNVNVHLNFITMYNVNAHLNFITMCNVNAHLNFIIMCNVNAHLNFITMYNVNAHLNFYVRMQAVRAHKLQFFLHFCSDLLETE
jgi:hypothetical protein